MLRWSLVLAGYLALILIGVWAGHLIAEWAVIDVRPINEPEVHRMLMMVVLAYILASAMPFVPGAEIGLALIAVFGARIVILVYLCTVTALALSYCIGRFIPMASLGHVFRFLRLRRAAQLLLEADALTPEERLRMLVARSPNRWIPFLLRHRHLALIVALNLPGNTIVGGGGGIGFVSGMSRIFPPVTYLATIGLAVLPLPLIVLLTGYQP